MNIRSWSGIAALFLSTIKLISLIRLNETSKGYYFNETSDCFLRASANAKLQSSVFGDFFLHRRRYHRLKGTLVLFAYAIQFNRFLQRCVQEHTQLTLLKRCDYLLTIR